MKSRKPWFPLVLAGALLAAPPLMARQAPSPAAQDTPADASAGDATHQVVLHTSQGQVTLRSTPPPAPAEAPAPPFEQLAAGGKFISESQASAYPLLANDFDHADRNRDGRISKAEYTRWLTKL